MKGSKRWAILKPAGQPGLVAFSLRIRIKSLKVFLFSATSPKGKKFHDRIEAANLDQARYALEIRGYRNIEFLNDENQADIVRAVRSGRKIRTLPPEAWTAEDEVKSHRRRGMMEKVWWAFKQHGLIFALLVFWLWFALRSQRPYGWFDWAAFLAVPLYFIWFVRLVLPIALFQLILEASVWHDWERLRRLIGFVRVLEKIFNTAIPAHELDVREATLLAAKGQMDDGLRLIAKYQGHADIAEHLYLSRLSGVFEAAGQYDRLVELREEAALKSPGGVSGWIDLAMARIRRKQDVNGARLALENIQGKELPATAGAFFLLVEGMIASEERDDVKACKCYRDGMEKLKATHGSPLVNGIISECKVRMAVSLARLGETDLAGKILAEERPLMEARGETVLLASCESALAGKTD